MAKPFDASLNQLIDLRPAEWAGFFAARAGVPPGPVEVLDTDLSSTLQADKLFRVKGPTAAALHLEFEVSGRLAVPDRLLRFTTWRPAGSWARCRSTASSCCSARRRTPQT